MGIVDDAIIVLLEEAMGVVDEAIRVLQEEEMGWDIR